MSSGISGSGCMMLWPEYDLNVIRYSLRKCRCDWWCLEKNWWQNKVSHSRNQVGVNIGSTCWEKTLVTDTVFGGMNSIKAAWHSCQVAEINNLLASGFTCFARLSLLLGVCEGCKGITEGRKKRDKDTF